MIQTKSALVITLIAVVAVIAASTIISKQVYAPTCTSCAKSFAPGQLATITNPASDFAPGQQPPGPATSTHGASDFAPGIEK